MNEDKSTRYQRQRRWASGLVLALRMAPAVVCLVPGVSPWAIQRLEEALQGSAFAGSTLGTVVAFALLLVWAGDLVALPVAWFAGVGLERRYRASRETTFTWGVGHVMTIVMRTLVVGVGTTAVYTVMRVLPEHWWIATGVLYVVSTLMLTWIGPVVVAPLVSELRPVTRPALRTRLAALARGVGASSVRFYEWRPKIGRSYSNAALVGLGRTRRVLLTDSLLSDYDEGEIEVVVAHELAHHVNGDVPKSIAWDGVVAVGVGAAAHQALTLVGERFAVGRIHDPAGLPLLVVAGVAALLALTPLRNFVSRCHERRADRDALTMTGNAAALISGFRRLAAESLAEARPPRLVRWLLATHPPFTDRVAAVSVNGATAWTDPGSRPGSSGRGNGADHGADRR